MKTLAKQLKNGGPSDYDVLNYDETDFAVTLPAIKQKLMESGFKPMVEKDFQERIKLVFGRIIDPAAPSKYLFVNYYDPCKYTSIFHPNNADIQGTFIVKNESFITDFYALPQIIDYQKNYPESAYLENQKITITDEVEKKEVTIAHWKDDPKLNSERQQNLQTIVARNMYLFNNSKAHYNWLILHDQSFMENLVKIFGYTEDKELVKWMVKKTLPATYSDYKENTQEALEKLLWTKNCNGAITFHQNTLEAIKELSSPENTSYILCLADYLQHGLCVGCDKEHTRKDLTFQQISEIAAHILEFGEQYKYDPQYNFNQMFLGNFYHYLDYDKNYFREFEKNNFYQLKHLKDWYLKASKEEDMFKGGDLPDVPQPKDYYYKSGK